MGQIGNGLDGALENAVLHFVEQEGKNNGSWKTENNVVNTDEQGVSDGPAKVNALEEAHKVVKAHPFAPEYSLCGHIVFKGDGDAV